MRPRRLQSALIIVTILLALVLAWEVMPAETGGSSAAGAGPAAAARPAAETIPPDRLAAIALARPLFMVSRKAAAATARLNAQQKEDLSESVVRLEGTVIFGDTRIAYLETGDGEKPVAAEEGDTVGGWTVLAIGAHSITVRTKTGNRTLEPLSVKKGRETWRAAHPEAAAAADDEADAANDTP